MLDRTQQHLNEQDRAGLDPELAIAGQMQQGHDYVARLLPGSLPATAAETDAVSLRTIRRWNRGEKRFSSSTWPSG
jgi:hypothetical protein